MGLCQELVGVIGFIGFARNGPLVVRSRRTGRHRKTTGTRQAEGGRFACPRNRTLRRRDGGVRGRERSTPLSCLSRRWVSWPCRPRTLEVESRWRPLRPLRKATSGRSTSTTPDEINDPDKLLAKTNAFSAGGSQFCPIPYARTPAQQQT